MAVKTEAEATWRLYVPEFTEVYTSDSAGVLGHEECRSVFADRYRGRVPLTDCRIVPMRSAQPSRYRLELLLPNLRGEWKDEDDAKQAYAVADLARDDKPDEQRPVLVRHGSKEEQELLATLRRRLRDE
jgi:hypothetical protein